MSVKGVGHKSKLKPSGHKAPPKSASARADSAAAKPSAIVDFDQAVSNVKLAETALAAVQEEKTQLKSALDEKGPTLKKAAYNQLLDTEAKAVRLLKESKAKAEKLQPKAQNELREKENTYSQLASNLAGGQDRKLDFFGDATSSFIKGAQIGTSLSLPRVAQKLALNVQPKLLPKFLEGIVWKYNFCSQNNQPEDTQLKATQKNIGNVITQHTKALERINDGSALKGYLQLGKFHLAVVPDGTKRASAIKNLITTFNGTFQNFENSDYSARYVIESLGPNGEIATVSRLSSDVVEPPIPWSEAKKNHVNGLKAYTTDMQSTLVGYSAKEIKTNFNNQTREAISRYTGLAEGLEKFATQAVGGVNSRRGLLTAELETARRDQAALLEYVKAGEKKPWFRSVFSPGTPEYFKAVNHGFNAFALAYAGWDINEAEKRDGAKIGQDRAVGLETAKAIVLNSGVFFCGAKGAIAGAQFGPWGALAGGTIAGGACYVVGDAAVGALEKVDLKPKKATISIILPTAGFRF